MALSLAQVILYLHPTLVSGVDFVIKNDSQGGGEYVAEWNTGVTQPTAQEITDATPAATTFYDTEIAWGNRENACGEVYKAIHAISKQIEAWEASVVPVTAEMQALIDDVNSADTNFPLPS